MLRLIAVLLLALLPLCMGAFAGSEFASRLKKFDCTNKAVGNYRDPTRECSPYFFTCVSGGEIGVLRNCSAPDTRYDSKSDRCLFPEFVTDCKGRETTTTTPRPTTRPALDADFDCAFRRSGDYVHPNKPCSSIFFSCVGGQVYQRECAGDLKFDPISRLCLSDEFVKPCGGRTTERTIVTTTTAQVVAGAQCEPDRAYFTVHPSNPCNGLYIGCEYGVARLLICPGDLRFDPDTTLCLERPFVAACGGSATPMPVYTSTARDPSLPAVSCSGRPLRVRFTERPCSSYFLVCNLEDGLAEVIFCAAGTFFDSDVERCNRREHVRACGGSPPGPEDFVQPTTVRPDRQAPSGVCNGVTGHTSWPGEECSQYFIICGPLGAANVFKCQGSLRYDALYIRCESPEYIPECGGTRMAPEDMEQPTSRPLPPVNFDCSSRVTGNYPSGQCSSRFFTCSNGVASQTDCPGGTVYGIDLDQCVPRRSVAACPEAQAAPSCGRADGFYAVFSDCGAYVVCQAYEVLMVQRCDEGLVFHPTRRRCLDPSDVPAPCGNKPPADTFTCDGRQIGYYRDVDDCGRYYYCEEDGSAWEFECTDGFSFDTSINECRIALEVADCGAPVPPPVMPDIPDLAAFCRIRSGLFPHPSDCGRTIVCLSKIRYVLVCPSDKPRFDVDLQDCTYADETCP